MDVPEEINTKSPTRTQSLFMGQIGLFLKERGLDRAEWAMSYVKRRQKNCALIYLNIQSPFRKK